MRLISLFLPLLLTLSLSARNEYAATGSAVPLKREVVPLGKTLFREISTQTGKSRTVDLKGKDFVLVSVREAGSDGRFYAVDRDGTVWLSGPVSSGAPQFRSPSGIFHVIEKRRYHMSNRYPDESGINNMDFMMKFTRWGHALHKGSVAWMSHGCIHVDPTQVALLYGWVRKGMPIVITRHSYMPFAREDLKRIY